jgi:hypothetical protein
MNKFIVAIMFTACSIGIINPILTNNAYAINDSDIDKILKAKDIVRSMVNYPDTLVFHEFYTKVSGNTVTLKFTCKNAFGTPETHIKDIRVN